MPVQSALYYGHTDCRCTAALPLHCFVEARKNYRNMLDHVRHLPLRHAVCTRPNMGAGCQPSMPPAAAAAQMPASGCTCSWYAVQQWTLARQLSSVGRRSSAIEPAAAAATDPFRHLRCRKNPDSPHLNTHGLRFDDEGENMRVNAMQGRCTEGSWRQPSILVVYSLAKSPEHKTARW